MGLQIISRQLTGRTVNANTDQVIAYIPLPAGTKLNNVWLDVSLHSGVATIASGVMYGISGFVVNVEDPEVQTDYDTLWDWTIQKDQYHAYGTVDDSTSGIFDSDSVNPEPEFEPGLVDLEAIFGGDLVGNMEIFRRRELITFAKRPVGFHTSADLATQYYVPVDSFKTHIRGGPRVSEPSVAMFGFSAPQMGQTQGSIRNTPTELEWIMEQYAQVFLFDAWKWLMGLSASTGEYPDAQAANWLAELLEDNMIETVDIILAAGYNVTTKATWDITVQGEPSNMTLTSE